LQPRQVRPGKLDQLETDVGVKCRYSPGALVSTKKRAVIGDPDESKICTSYIERANLSIRMTNRRYTRLTNAFSKRAEMHRLSIAMTFFAYNLIKKHRSLGGKDSGDGGGDHGPHVYGSGHALRGGSGACGSGVADSRISRLSFASRQTKKYLVRY